MSFLGLTIVIVAVIAFAIYAKRLEWSKLKEWRAYSFICFVCFTIISCGGSSGSGNSSDSIFNDTAVSNSVKNCLSNRTNYENIHILNVKKVDETDEYVTFNWNAEFKWLGLLSRESGFVYYYKNGDLKDFKRMNDLHVVGK